MYIWGEFSSVMTPTWKPNIQVGQKIGGALQKTLVQVCVY